MRRFAIGWLISSVLILHLSSIPPNGVLIASVLALLVGIIFVPGVRSFCAGIFIAIVTLGLTLTQVVDHQLLPAQMSENIDIEVRIASIPERDDYRLTFMAKILDCLSCQHKFGPQLVRLSWYGRAPEIRANEVWQLTVRLKPLGSLRNPGGFDAIKWAMAKGIHAKGYIKEPQHAVRVQAANRFAIDSTRQLLSERLTGLPSADQFVGIISALSLGIRHEVDDADWQLLRDTGTAHLLAISGLHVSLVALWGFVVGRQLTRCCLALSWINPVRAGNLEPRTVGLALSFILACTYTIISGFELPTQRALVMLLVWLIAAWYFRYLPPGAALCIALSAVLLVNPLNTLTVGFWLSFGTVGALFYLHNGHQIRTQSGPHADGLKSKTRKISHLLRTHVLISVCLLPLGAWFFQSGSLVAPLANLLAVPWTAIFIVPFSLISAGLSALVPAVANISLYVAQWSVGVLLGYLSLLDQLLPAAVTLSLPSTGVLFLTISGLLSLLAPRGLGLRWLAGPLLAPAILFNLQRSPIDGFELHVLDVGQGLAALVFTDERTLLFDTGGKVSRSLSMFEAVVVPYLHAKGRRSIDTLVVSHSDEDHSFGAKDLIARYPDVQIFTSNRLKLPETVNQQPCVAGDSWTSGSVNFAFLHPAVHDRGSKNDLSCVMLVYTGSSRVLLTGDIESQGEFKLAGRVRPGDKIDLDVLVAPHHGSATSSSQYLLDVFEPEYVVFPSGQRNRYGFPHADVQLRYNLLGAQTFTTGTDGAVSFLLGESGLYKPPLSWWKSHRRFWHGIINPDCWPLSARKSNVLRMLELAQKGQTLCGK